MLSTMFVIFCTKLLEGWINDMAVTNLWAVKGNLSAVVKYIENPEKTTARDMEQVMTYISDANKTEQMMYVTGIKVCCYNNLEPVTP